MRVNFICQLDWLIGCSDIWSNMILGVSGRVFLDEISIGMDRLSKGEGALQCGWDSSNQLKARIEQKDLVSHR